MPEPAQTKLVACVWYHFDLWCFPEWLAQAIRQRYPEMKVVHLPDYKGLEAELPDTDIFVGWSLRPEQFALAKKLKWIHATAAGVNQLMYEGVRRSSVVVTNSRGVMTIPMAEHTLGLILALARRIPSAVQHQAQKHWAQQDIWNEQPPPTEINGRTLLVVGYGAIGQELGRRARALGMRVVGVKRDPSSGTEHADAVVGSDRLREVLGEADFVVLATPVTPETEHAFGQQEFEAMKESAHFINVGRGTLVETGALIKALQKKKIAGAAIDVAEQEPLPPESPLWSAPNLLITPHLSAASERLWHRHAALLLDNLNRYFKGQELRNVVDKQRGY